MSNKLVVIGGGAGGGSFAARVRRHDNDAEIVIYERSPFVSYSNCGQPYLISGAKPNFDAIIVYSPQDWKEQYNVVAKPSHEVVGIDRKKKTVTVKNLISGETFEDSYDKLVIAAGSPALMPPIPGADAKNVHVLKTPDHLQAIMKDLKGAKNAVVIGAGFIGLEIAENLAETKVKTTVIDSAPSLLGKVMDEDFAVFVNKALDENNVDLKLNSGVVSINKDGKEVELADGTKIPTDIIFMVVGVRPELNMYKDEGLTVGVTGGLKVDKSSLTNDKDIYAVGDLAETVDWKGQPSRIQLAIVAQRMATIGANHMYGVADEFKGVQNSASLTVFGTTVAAVGYTEAYLNEKGIKYTKAIGIEQHAILHGENVYLKVLYDAKGMILGAQSAGPNSAEKRVNYAAIAMMHNIPVQEMLHFQTAYNPAVDTQRDPINLVARIARAQQAKLIETTTVVELAEYLKKGYILLDVRTKEEFDAGHIKGATLLPLQEFTEKLDSLDKSKKYVLYCRRGARAYNAQLRMTNAGHKNVVNVLGAWDHFDVYSKYRNGVCAMTGHEDCNCSTKGNK